MLAARTRDGRPARVVATDGSLDALAQTAGWSPIVGCRDGITAYARARVLAGGTSAGVDDGDFWEGQTRKVLQFLLHAAHLMHADIERSGAGRSPRRPHGQRSAQIATSWS